jgi:outer membrane protein assembly factor BamB
MIRRNRIGSAAVPACRFAVLSTFLCVLCSTSISLRAADDDLRPGEDWPIFLGPQGTGVSKETGLLDKWPDDGPPVVWKKKIGTGYSAPSVLGHRLVVIHRPKHEDIVQCLHAATGEELWKYAYDTDYTDPYGYNNGPRCTPLLTKNRCYTFGAQGKLLSSFPWAPNV